MINLVENILNYYYYLVSQEGFMCVLCADPRKCRWTGARGSLDIKGGHKAQTRALSGKIIDSDRSRRRRRRRRRSRRHLFVVVYVCASFFLYALRFFAFIFSPQQHHHQLSKSRCYYYYDWIENIIIIIISALCSEINNWKYCSDVIVCVRLD